MTAYQFRAADPGTMFQVKVRITYRANSIWMPMIREDLIAFEVLQSVSVVGCPHSVWLITFELQDRIMLNKGEFQVRAR
jgi:hypothetical protein